MKRLARYFIALGVMVSGFGIAAAIPSTPASAACTSSFLTFPAWYKGVIDESTCEIKAPNVDKNGGGLPTFLFRIVLNIIEIALQLVAYAAAGYLIYGGFKYLTSSGSADRVTSGRKIITNALVGLIISFMSVAIVNLVTSNIDAPKTGSCNANAGVKIDPDCVAIAKVGSNQALTGILTTVYYAAGITAVIVIIISSIFYVISQGDPSKTKRAKDGILYAVVGLVLVLVAFIITNFIIGRF
jgi:threonine/homoserine/homoserine lactone efflux protein